ncbi:MAG: hypothetical protein ACTS5F_00900 [Candidatus Hodgkinia cicadicola]
MELCLAAIGKLNLAEVRIIKLSASPIDEPKVRLLLVNRNHSMVKEWHSEECKVLSIALFEERGSWTIALVTYMNQNR